jgi:fermentation-respiration switch protein FrsA (DUF1100 family)
MKTWVKVLIGIAIALVVLLVVAYFGMGYVIYDKLGNVKGSCDEHLANRPDNFALHPKWPAGFDVTPYFMSGYETVKFPSRDPAIEVAGWWIPKDPAAPAVILVHGQGGCKNSIDMLVPAGMLWRNGFNVLLIDLRDVGDSTFEDGRSTIGNAEYQDVLGAWDWLVKEKGIAPKRIGLFANSLGGASANYAFSEEPRVAALFLQSTFGNLRQVLAAELTRAGFPTFLAPGALVAGSIVTGANLFGHNPLDAVRKDAGRPIYIVHTRADTRIDSSQSEQLAAAAQAAGANVTTWFPENGEHVQTPAVYPEAFEQRLVGFFRETLGQP